MGWFDEQINMRNRRDEKAVENAFFDVIDAVTGKHFSNSEEDVCKVIKSIVAYYGCREINIPTEIEDLYEKINYCCRPNGIAYRKIKLTDKWHKDGTGVILAFTKDNRPVALFPKKTVGYYYVDSVSGKKTTINSKNKALFEEEALCFYRPLPLRKITSRDYFKFCIKALSTADIVTLVFLSMLTTAAGLLIPKFNYFFVSKVTSEGSIRLLLSTLVFMISVLIVSILIKAVNGIIEERMSKKLETEIQAATMQRIILMPVSFFKSNSSGEIANRLTYITQACSTAFSAFFDVLLTCIFSLSYFIEIFNYSSELISASIIILLANLVCCLFKYIYEVKHEEHFMEQNAKNAGITYAMLCGMQKIKLAGAEKRMFARWAGEYAKEAKISYRPKLFLRINESIFLAISLAGQILIYYVAKKYEINEGAYFAFNSAYTQIMTAVTALFASIPMIAKIKATMHLSGSILETEPEAGDCKREILNLKGKIELKNVSFRYNSNTENVIEDFSLKINPGEYVAIVGKSGSGKTTIARLLLGLETPTGGSIFYDGKDIQGIDKRSLRRKVGSVLQNSSLFQGDILSNILMTSTNLTIEDVQKAIRIADIADDIDEMPMGLFTMLTDGSKSVSGGQAQRILIARAVVNNPKVLIFDEATSALDNISQSKISNALELLNCTRIVIAHRLSTIKNCDRIVVIDNGKIVETGNYEELISQKGVFFELVKNQQSEM